MSDEYRSPAVPKGFGYRVHYENMAFTQGTASQPAPNTPDLSLTASTELTLGVWGIPTDYAYIHLDRIIFGFGGTRPYSGYVTVKIGPTWEKQFSLLPILRDKNAALYFGGMKVRGGQKITLKVFTTTASTTVAAVVRYTAVGKKIPQIDPTRPDLWQEYYEGTDSWARDQSLTTAVEAALGTWTVEETFDVINLKMIQAAAAQASAVNNAGSKHSAGGAFGQGSLNTGYLRFKVDDTEVEQIPMVCLFADLSSALHFGRMIPGGGTVSLWARQDDGATRTFSVNARYRGYFKDLSDIPLPDRPEKAVAEEDGGVP